MSRGYCATCGFARTSEGKPRRPPTGIKKPDVKLEHVKGACPVCGVELRGVRCTVDEYVDPENPLLTGTKLKDLAGYWCASCESVYCKACTKGDLGGGFFVQSWKELECKQCSRTMNDGEIVLSGPAFLDFVLDVSFR